MFEDYAAAVENYKETFIRYGYPQFADRLPELRSVGSAVKQRAASESEVSAGGSSLSIVAVETQVVRLRWSPEQRT